LIRATAMPVFPGRHENAEKMQNECFSSLTETEKPLGEEIAGFRALTSRESRIIEQSVEHEQSITP
jgi:hypothetical protein